MQSQERQRIITLVGSAMIYTLLLLMIPRRCLAAATDHSSTNYRTSIVLQKRLRLAGNRLVMGIGGISCLHHVPSNDMGTWCECTYWGSNGARFHVFYKSQSTSTVIFTYQDPSDNLSVDRGGNVSRSHHTIFPYPGHTRSMWRTFLELLATNLTR